ncbi:MAG TPA: trehalase family glycosidase, partial [Sediminibacterium sp.]|nr:trehalase family glycosidase [Sediminibacterium sp.]
FAQTVERNIKTKEYKLIQKSIAQGWNTWYNNSVMSHVLLPEGFSINICVSRPGRKQYLREITKYSKAMNHPEELNLGMRSDDGSYTSLTMKYLNEEMQIETATDGKDQFILVTPKKELKNILIIEAGLLWGRNGSIGVEGNQLFGKLGGKTITVQSTEKNINDAYLITSSPNFVLPLKKELGIYTGTTKNLSQIKKIIAENRAIQEKRVNSYKEYADLFNGMQSALAWSTIYDAPNQRVMTPVSRNWSSGWGGFTLFDWDTYFGSYMCSLFNKDLAYANAIEMTKSITPFGFVPNYKAPFDNVSWDRSQPPIGSTVILNIYNQYHEKWFLQEVYDELLTWNRFWANKRDVNGYLSWGSNEIPDSLQSPGQQIHSAQAAQFESGLDNSPMFDGIPFNSKTNTMELADVGLMSLYIMDCNSLATIAEELGRKENVKEFKERSARYAKKLNTLWDEQAGIFLNKRLDNGEKSYRLSPTNFYPMLAKACTQQQAETMMKKHYFNPNEFYGEFVMPSISRNDTAFKGNTYWRGRIWAPLNMLVYMGMRNYQLPEARKDLTEKSKALFLKSWKEDGGIYENYNSVTGQGSDVRNADGYYHWGALLAFMSLLESELK